MRFVTQFRPHSSEKINISPLVLNVIFAMILHRIKKEIMQITRHHHLRYMTKLTPLLIFLYVLQVIIYQKFAPSHLSGEMNLFLGIGLALIILCFQFYDQHHQIHFKENYLEARFDLLKIKDQILYQNIVTMEIKQSKGLFGHVVLHKKDGTTYQLHHVDSPELVIEFISQKKARSSCF